MKLSEFKFELPNNLIALDPADNRDESRLMVVHRESGEIEHKEFKDIVEYFNENDILAILHNGCVILRRVKKIKDGFKLIPSNSQYPIEFIPSIASIGKVNRVFIRQ